MVAVAERMPICLGSYESGDPQCEGFPGCGATLDEVLPCLFRDRCVAFGKLVAKTKRDPSDFIRRQEVTRGPFQGTFTFPIERGFLQKLDEQIVLYGISSGRVTNRSGVLSYTRKRRRRACRLGAQTPAHRRKLSRAMRRRMTELRRNVERRGWESLVLIATTIGRPLRKEEVGARPEELFLVDQLTRKGFGALYYRLRRFNRKFSQRPVVRFYARVHRGWVGTLELQVACPYDAFFAALSKRDRLRFGGEKREKFDSFGVTVRRAGHEEISIVAETVAKLARLGRFGFGQ